MFCSGPWVLPAYILGPMISFPSPTPNVAAGRETGIITREQTTRGVAQLGRVPALGAGCRRFKSSRPDQPTKFNAFANLSVITLYVLKGKNGKRYVGITNDLPRRIYEHRLKNSKAGQLLGEFQVIHTEPFGDHSSARKREKFLKSGQGRKWLDSQELASESARGG